VQQLYQQSRLPQRKISNAEHARCTRQSTVKCHPARKELQPLHRHSGASSSWFPASSERIPERNAFSRRCKMAETAFHTRGNADRLAEPFPTDPWTGDKVQLFNMLEKPVMESGGGGLISTRHGLCGSARCAQRRRARWQQDRRRKSCS